MTTFLVTQGTSTNLANDVVGTNIYPVSKIDIGAAGASSLFTGTLGAVTNLAGGTVGVLTSGTVDTVGLLNANYFSTVVSTGTNTFGTIKASVAGSAIYVTDLIVSVGSVTTLEIGDGTVGATDLIGTLQLNQYGGMVSNFRSPIKTSVSGTLVYKQSVGCPLTITAIGYVK